jgi:hypothetical protein
VKTISNIIEALRRVGKPTQKSALRRQDEQLQGKEVLGRRRVVTRSKLGTAETFVATTAPVPETVIPMTDIELVPVLENASAVGKFLKCFLSRDIEKWTLDDLDCAFQTWSSSSNKRGYTNEAVVEITGAAFGQFCVENLNMRWVKVCDARGTDLAVQGVKKSVRAYPFSSVSKRITDSEYGFFKPVHISIESASHGDWEHS